MARVEVGRHMSKACKRLPPPPSDAIAIRQQQAHSSFTQQARAFRESQLSSAAGPKRPMSPAGMS